MKTAGSATHLAVGAVLVVAAAVVLWLLFGTRHVAEPAPLTGVSYAVLGPSRVIEHPAAPRTTASYEGLGAWVDGFDYSPPYSASGVPPLVPASLNDMAEAGVQTLYLQSGRLDDRSPELLEDPWLLTEFLMRADQLDIDVVAWYLPKWTEDTTDLDHLTAAHNFDVLGYRFDGVAVDIEWNQDGLDVEERNRRFVQLSRSLRLQTGGDPIGAIVLPPVQTEVINPSLWPNFPWADIAGLYDVWLPMAYWSFRTDPYGDGYRYNEESVRRLRSNLSDESALVHSIGGIGAQLDTPPAGTEPYLANVDQLDAFARSLADTEAIGGSIYDWLTLDEAGRREMADLFSTGPAAELGQ